MSKEIQIKQEWNPSAVMEDLQNTQKMCSALMQTPHYKRMGGEGIFAIVQKAKAMKLNPLDALNGGMYCVNGKVEMSSHMMATLIRNAGHSFTKDKRSDDTICILHGKRKDNGDTWTESFSIADAKRAGIYKNTWEKFPRNMLFARALSNLARQLFPDVIGGCYVEGEISQAPPLDFPINAQEPREEPLDAVVDYETITSEQLETLESKLAEHLDIKQSLIKWLNHNKNTEDLSFLPQEIYPKMMARIEKVEQEKSFEMESAQYGEQLQMAIGG